MSTENALNWDNLTISNNFIFSKVMQDKEICKELINILLELNINNINCVEYKKVINIEEYNEGGVDSVELDSTYIEDEHNTIYNIEICTNNDVNVVNKLMLYQHVVNINLMSKSIHCDVLPDIYTIFICTFDICNDDSCKYYFQEKSSEDDNLHKIVFNTTSYNDANNNNLKLLLKYINGDTFEKDEANNDFIKKLDNKINQIKLNEKYKLEYIALVNQE
ncbi:MAG: hypothetical protein R3Y29_05270 [bacterium]